MKVLIVPSGREATRIAMLAQVSSVLGEHLTSPCQQMRGRGASTGKCAG